VRPTQKLEERSSENERKVLGMAERTRTAG
jgi:hypothetical protein